MRACLAQRRYGPCFLRMNDWRPLFAGNGPLQVGHCRPRPDAAFCRAIQGRCKNAARNRAARLPPASVPNCARRAMRGHSARSLRRGAVTGKARGAAYRRPPILRARPRAADYAFSFVGSLPSGVALSIATGRYSARRSRALLTSMPAASASFLTFSIPIA
jgi:hypothetical protein